MPRVFESVPEPSKKEVVSSYRKVIADNIREIRRNVDRGIARRVLDEIKKDKTFQEIAARHREETAAAMTDEHLVGELLRDSNYYRLREVVSPEDRGENEIIALVDKIITSEENAPEEMEQALDGFVFPEIRESGIEAKKSVAETAQKKQQERQVLLAEEEKRIAEINSLQNELSRKIESLQVLSEESSGFSNTDVLLKQGGAFPESIRTTIEELLKEPQGKVDLVLNRLIGGGYKRKKATQIALNYLNALYAEAQTLEKEKGEHVSKKLSLESSPEKEELLGSVVKDVLKRKVESRLDAEKNRGLEGAANIPAIIDQLNKSERFTINLVSLAKEALFFTDREGEAVDVAMQSKPELSMENIEALNNRRVELHNLRERITSLERLMTSSLSPNEISKLAEEINTLNQRKEELSGDIADKAKLIAGMVSRTARKIVGDASKEGLRKMASEFERIFQACNVISEKVFGLGIEELIQNNHDILNAINKSWEMARETIVNIVNDEIKRAIGETPVPENDEDKRQGAFDIEAMEEYVKKGGSAAEVIVVYDQKEYCFKYHGYEPPPGYIRNIKDLKNKRLPWVLIEPLITTSQDGEALYLSRRGDYQLPVATSESIMWFPIKKEIAIERSEDLRRAFDIYMNMTESSRTTPRGRILYFGGTYVLPECDDLTDYLGVDVKLHTPSVKYPFFRHTVPL